MTSPIAFPSQAGILAALNTRLTGDAALVALVPNIFNHIPQERPTPLLRFRWEMAREWDTKDSVGYDGIITLDFWTDYRGDKLGLQVHDALMNLLHLQPLTLASGQSLILHHDFHTSLVEGDGVTHHAVDQFRHVATT